jgi:hypothetical protein
MWMIAGTTAVETAEMPKMSAKNIVRRRCDRRLLSSPGILFPFFIASGRVLQISQALFAFEPRIAADLMIRVYVKARFAKMTAVPDKLIETPDRVAVGAPWTSWTTSLARFA